MGSTNEAANPLFTFGRFLVYVKDKETNAIQLNYRLIPKNIRKQTKGLGAATFDLLPNQQHITNVDNSSAQYTAFWRLPQANEEIYVVDRNMSDPNTNAHINFQLELDSPTAIIFRGHIKSVSYDKYQKEDSQLGVVLADEIGFWYFQTQMYDLENIIFNPKVDNIWIGNKTANDLSFNKQNSHVRLKTKDTQNEIRWPTENQSKVWSLEEVLQYVCAGAGLQDPSFPWDADQSRINSYYNAQILSVQQSNLSSEQIASQVANLNSERTNETNTNESKYFIFKDKSVPRSYPSAYGQNLISWLDEVLPECIGYRFNVQSSFQVTIEFYNKAFSQIDEVVPTVARPINYAVNDDVTATVTITQSDESWDSIEVLSERVLWCGTFQTNKPKGDNTLESDWGAGSSETYDNEKAYAWGGANIIEPATLPDVWRKYDGRNVYSKFKWVPKTDDVYIALNEDPLNLSRPSNPASPLIPFFGTLETSGTQLVINSEVHKTPDPTSLSWSTKLPFSIDDNNNLLEPYALATYWDTDLSKRKYGPIPESPRLTLDMNGIRIEMGIPETLAYRNTDGIFKLGNFNYLPGSSQYDWADSAATSQRNPDTSTYEYLTNYNLLFFTVAGFSNQRISISKNNPTSSIINKKKKIIVPEFNYWVIHKNTLKPKITLSSFSDVYYEPLRFDNDIIIRNDYEAHKKYANTLANWLFVDKKSLNVDLALMKVTSLGLEIGYPIKSIKDKQIISVNTTIESIEYDFNETSPRIRFNTLIPDLPGMRKYLDNAVSPLAPSLSDLKFTKETKNGDFKLENKVETQIGDIVSRGGDGGGGASPAEIWLKIVTGSGAGNTLSSGQYGIKKILTQLTEQNTWKDVYATATLPDGLGRATLWKNGIQQYTVDANLFVAGNTYSVNDQVSFNDIGYKCTVAGTATTFNVGATFVVDNTIPKKPKQVFLLLDTRAQFNYAVLHSEWIRVFSEVTFGNAINPATGVAENQVAYTGAFF